VYLVSYSLLLLGQSTCCTLDVDAGSHSSVCELESNSNRISEGKVFSLAVRFVAVNPVTSDSHFTTDKYRIFGPHV
jgi:hypothetical protein